MNKHASTDVIRDRTRKSAISTATHDPTFRQNSTDRALRRLCRNPKT